MFKHGRSPSLSHECHDKLRTCSDLGERVRTRVGAETLALAATAWIGVCTRLLAADEESARDGHEDGPGHDADLCGDKRSERFTSHIEKWRDARSSA